MADFVPLWVGNVMPDVHLVEASLQQILKSSAALLRRTKGGWQSVSGLNRPLFAQNLLRTPD